MIVMIIEMIIVIRGEPEGGGVVEVFRIPDLHGLVDLQVRHPDLIMTMIMMRMVMMMRRTMMRMVMMTRRRMMTLMVMMMRRTMTRMVMTREKTSSAKDPWPTMYFPSLSLLRS